MSNRSEDWIFRGLLVLTAVVAALFALSLLVPYDSVRHWLDRHAGDGSADPYTPQLDRQLRGWLMSAVVMGAVAAGAWRQWTKSHPDPFRKLCTELVADSRSLSTEVVRLVREEWLALLLLSLLALLFRLPWINLPMRYDEATTWLNYASQPWFVAIAKYDEPNNHIPHSLEMLLVSRWIGDAPWQLRLPALLCGVLVVPATCLLGRVLAGRWGGLIAGLIACGSTALIEYATNARGYSQLVLCTLLCWLSAAAFHFRRNQAGGLLLILSGAAGLWTVPTMIIPLSAVWAWLMLMSWSGERARALTAVVLLTAGLTLLCYLPVLAVSSPVLVLQRIAGGSPPADVRWLQVLDGAWSTIRLLFRDWPWWGLLPGGLCLVAGMLPRTSEGQTMRMAAVALLLALLSAVFGNWPPPRTWIWMIPLAGVGIGSGARALSARFPNLCSPVAVASLFSLASGFSFLTAVQQESISRSAETGLFPIAPELVEELRPELGDRDRIVAVTPVSAPLVYAARRSGLPESLFERPTRADRIWIVRSPAAPESVSDVLGELRLTDLPAGAFQPVRSDENVLIDRYSPPLPR